MEHTEGEWINGYGRGVAGPTAPTSGCPFASKNIRWTVISKGERVIAIVPLYYPEDTANAQLITAAPKTARQRDALLAGCKLALGAIILLLAPDAKVGETVKIKAEYKDLIEGLATVITDAGGAPQATTKG